jgi:hypothetical protein
VESFNFRSICFRPDLAEALTLRPTRGPRCDGKAAYWKMGFMPLPDLGPPMAMVSHVQRPPHTLAHLPRFSSPGHTDRVARSMRMQAAWPRAVYGQHATREAY